METTISSFLKQGATPAIVLVALFFAWNDLNGDSRELRYEMTELRDEMTELRVETAAGFREIRAGMAEEFKAVRAEMAEGDRAIRAEMAEEFKSVRSDISVLGERMARVETRLASVERVLYADLDPPPQ